MDIQPLDIVIYLINIGVLFVLLRMVLFKPVRKFLDARSSSVAKELDDAKAAMADADELKANYAASMQDADQQVKKLILEGTRQANVQAAQIVDAANGKAKELLSDAREKSAVEREEAIAALQTQITDMAVALAERILQREVNQADNQKVIDTFFSKAR